MKREKQVLVFVAYEGYSYHFELSKSLMDLIRKAMDMDHYRNTDGKNPVTL
jgi:hypothetical protein